MVCLAGKLIPSAATAASAIRQKPGSAAIAAVGERCDWGRSGQSQSTGRR